MRLHDLACLADRPRQACPKGKTRLEETIAQQPQTRVDEKTFRADVWQRDHSLCRCCGRQVKRTMARVPNRGEVHHIHGRGKDLRFEAKCALLLCRVCHEYVTGRVNAHRWIIVPTNTFTLEGRRYTDARAPVWFKESA